MKLNSAWLYEVAAKSIPDFGNSIYARIEAGTADEDFSGCYIKGRNGVLYSEGLSKIM